VRLLGGDASEVYVRLWYLEALRGFAPEVVRDLRDHVWALWRVWRVPETWDSAVDDALAGWARKWSIPQWGIAYVEQALADWTRRPDAVAAHDPPPWTVPRRGAPVSSSPWDWEARSAVTVGVVGLSWKRSTSARGGRPIDIRGPGEKRTPLDPMELLVRHVVLRQSLNEIARTKEVDARAVARSVRSWARRLDLPG
jgi:hypothetical protein